MDRILGDDCPSSDADAGSLFRVAIGDMIGPDFAPMANDIVRMVCIQAAIQMMIVLSSGGGSGGLACSKEAAKLGAKVSEYMAFAGHSVASAHVECGRVCKNL